MSLQHAIDQRAETHDAAANTEPLDLEGLHEIVEDNRHVTAHRKHQASTPFCA